MLWLLHASLWLPTLLLYPCILLSSLMLLIWLLALFVDWMFGGPSPRFAEGELWREPAERAVEEQLHRLLDHHGFKSLVLEGGFNCIRRIGADWWPD